MPTLPCPLEPDQLQQIDAWWRAANYLSVGQLYLRANALLTVPLQQDQIKPIVVGHWGTVPGQNFIYAHLNRVIARDDLDMIYISGPGHGGQSLLSNTWLEGSYSEIYPAVSQDAAGMQALFAQFSSPGGVSSHAAPATPGSIHEGGELGYSLAHAFGAAFDNPGLIVACVVGDGEAETGPLAAAWQGTRILNPLHDGVVLPILHLNGYKISNPTLLARIGRDELAQYLQGCGWSPLFVEGDEPALMHQAMAAALDQALGDLRRIRDDAHQDGGRQRPRWPMIVLRSPKGWTGPRQQGGLRIEGSFRSHQVPIPVDAAHPGNLALLAEWMNSYRPRELFNEAGQPLPFLLAGTAQGARRMGANPQANGGLQLQDLDRPAIRAHAIALPHPGNREASDMQVLAGYLADLVERPRNRQNFRLFGPDESLSNQLGEVLDHSSRQWLARLEPEDDRLGPDGRVLDAVLSEHLCQGWLEGYLLTGRHGIFNSYEAFVRIIDSMFSQHAKWLKVCAELPWRRPIASLNYLLASHVWQQDHNGYTHQDPGFIDHVAAKKGAIVRIYLPPDANCLLAVTHHCLGTRDKVNVIVAGKHAMPQWLDIEAAERHCERGISLWPWAGNDQDQAPDLVMAACGDTPTLEILAAVTLLRKHLPALRIRVINVVDLMRLASPDRHPHGLDDAAFDALFTTSTPVVFAFHGYPALIEQLIWQRHNRHFRVHGYQEEGTITTAFDMRVLNRMDRFHLVQSAIESLPAPGAAASYLHQAMADALTAHHRHIRTQGQDLPEVKDWIWPT